MAVDLLPVNSEVSLKKPIKFQIYGLSHPVTDELRYVGRTTQTLAKRLKNHCSPAAFRPDHRSNWVKSLREQGLKPKIELIEECVSSEAMLEAEKFYIEYFLFLGFRLVNCTSGGDGGLAGMPRRPMPREAVLRGIESRRQGAGWAPLSVEHKAALIKANTGRKKSPETLAKMSASAKGALTPEGRASMIAKKKGKKLPPDQVERLRLVHLGVKNPKKGRPRTEEEKRHLSEIGKGRIFSEEHRRKISEGLHRRFARERAEKEAKERVNARLV